MLRTLIAAGLRQQGGEAGLATCRAAAVAAAAWAGRGTAAASGECSSSGRGGGSLSSNSGSWPWEGRGWRGMAHSSSGRCSSGTQWEALRQQVRPLLRFLRPLLRLLWKRLQLLHYAGARSAVLLGAGVSAILLAWTALSSLSGPNRWPSLCFSVAGLPGEPVPQQAAPIGHRGELGWVLD